MSVDMSLEGPSGDATEDRPSPRLVCESKRHPQNTSVTKQANGTLLATASGHPGYFKLVFSHRGNPRLQKAQKIEVSAEQLLIEQETAELAGMLKLGC